MGYRRNAKRDIQPQRRGINDGRSAEGAEYNSQGQVRSEAEHVAPSDVIKLAASRERAEYFGPCILHLDVSGFIVGRTHEEGRKGSL